MKKLFWKLTVYIIIEALLFCRLRHQSLIYTFTCMARYSLIPDKKPITTHDVKLKKWLSCILLNPSALRGGISEFTTGGPPDTPQHKFRGLFSAVSQYIQQCSMYNMNMGSFSTFLYTPTTVSSIDSWGYFLPFISSGSNGAIARILVV